MIVNRREALRYLAGAGAAAAIPGAFGCDPGGPGAAGPTGGLQGQALYPPFDGATDLGFFGHLQNAVGEKSYRAQVDGRLPADLQGTLYRNGPGLFERAGVRKGAIVDGDGMIRRYRFADGQVTYTNRFVRTPKFVAESAAGRFLHDTWTTELPQTPDAPDGHNAGVTAVLHDGKLYAMDEVQAPFLLDAGSLETIGIAANFVTNLPANVAANLAQPGWSFKAHTRKDPARDEWICFANRFHERGLSVAHHIFDGAGNRVHSREVDPPLPGYMHDFFVTEDWIIYFNMPALPQLAQLDQLGFARSLGWVPQAGTHLVLVPRRGDDPPITIQTEARWMWHAVNAFQRGGEIIADYVGYDAPDHMLFLNEGEEPAFYAWMKGKEGAFDHPGKVRRLVIDLAGRRAREEILLEGNHEFPAVSRVVNGRPHRHTYVVRAAGRSQWWDTLVELDTERGQTASYPFGAGYFLGEPVYAPDVDRARPEQDVGWLLVPVYEERRAASSLAVFQVGAIADGPLASVRLQDHDPFNFHGYWETARGRY